jgi:hypothetical protein
VKTQLQITAALGVWMLIAGSIAGYAQDKDATKEIRNTIRLDQAQRQKIHKRLGDGGSKESACAMLVLRDGRWRIVSISVPK